MGDNSQTLTVTRKANGVYNKVGSFAIPAVGSGTFNAGSWFPKTIKQVDFYTGDTIAAGSFKIRLFRSYNAPTVVTSGFTDEILYAVTARIEKDQDTYDSNGPAKSENPNQVWFYAESGVTSIVNVYWVARHD